MNQQDARRLFAYTEWANERMITVIRGLADEQFTRRIESSFSSIRDTLAHMVMAEWIWLRRWKGENPSAEPAWCGQQPSLDKTVQELRAVEAERAAWIEKLDDAAFAASLSYKSMKGDPFTNTLADQITHVANHATYHRGQLTTMLRQVGAAPVNTDFTGWLRSLK